MPQGLIDIRLAENIIRKYVKKTCSLWKKMWNYTSRKSIAFSDIEPIHREMFQYYFIGRLWDGSKYWSEPDWKQHMQNITERIPTSAYLYFQFFHVCLQLSDFERQYFSLFAGFHGLMQIS